MYPHVTDSSGSSISQDFHLHGNRHRRGASHIDTHSRTLYLNISGQGQNFHLKVISNDKLLAPGFKVYHRKHHNRTLFESEVLPSEETWKYSNCHFSGKLTSRDDSSTAISLCDGVVCSSKLYNNILYEYGHAETIITVFVLQFCLA